MSIPFLQRLAVVIRRRYRTVFGVTLVLVVLSLAAASRLRFDTDVLNLLPRNAPQVQTLRQALDDFGSIDLLVIAIRVPSDASLGPYGELVGRIGQALSEIDSLSQVDYQLGELDELFATFLPNAFLFLNEEGRSGSRTNSPRSRFASE